MKNNIALTHKTIKEKLLGSNNKYPGFQRRIISALIDCTLISIIFLPIFSIVETFLYGPVFPQELIGKALKEMTELKNNTGNNLDFTAFIKSKPELYDYFYTHHGFTKMFIDQILQLSTLCVLFLVFWIKKQSTPGKMMLSMKIVDAKTLGKPSNKQFYLRILGYIIAILPLFLGIIWIAFDSKKQGWHDKIANTLVVNVEKNKK